MKITNDILFEILIEQDILKTTRTKPIVDAIKNRNPITFYYSGPRKPKKTSVKAGNRVKAEVVALGVSKKGNLIIRAFVQPPSTSKKGFMEHGWRTFMVTRMNNVQIHNDETFENKKPNYKEGDDKSMSVTYVTSDWTKQPKINKVTKPLEKPIEPTKPTVKDIKPEPKVKTIEPKPEELPQPKPEEKPSKDLTQIKDKEFQDKQKQLYNTKKSEWIDNQNKVGGNTNPGQGTRDRFNKEVEKELPQPKSQEKPIKNIEDVEDIEDNQIKETKKLKLLSLSPWFKKNIN